MVASQLVIANWTTCGDTGASPEWVDDGRALDMAAVGHVLRVQLATAERPRSRHDSRVPIGKAVLGFVLNASVMISTVVSCTLKRSQLRMSPDAISCGKTWRRVGRVART